MSTGKRSPAKWSKVEKSTMAKCVHCDVAVARDDTGDVTEVFRAARDHAEEHAHTVVIRQVVRMSISAC